MGCIGFASTHKNSGFGHDPGHERHALIIFLPGPDPGKGHSNLHSVVSAACKANAISNCYDVRGSGLRPKCLAVVVLCDLAALSESHFATSAMPKSLVQAEAEFLPIITVITVDQVDVLPELEDKFPYIFSRILAVAPGGGVDANQLLSEGLSDCLLNHCDQSFAQSSSLAQLEKTISTQKPTEDSSVASPHPELDAAVVLVLNGLNGSPELNECLVILQGFNADTQRFHVRVLGDSRVVSVAPDKLQPLGIFWLGGIHGRSELNGMQAVPMRCSERDRLEVKLLRTGETVAVRPDHVKFELPPPQNDAPAAIRNGDSVERAALEAADAVAVLESLQSNVKSRVAWTHVEPISRDTCSNETQLLEKMGLGMPMHDQLRPKSGILKHTGKSKIKQAMQRVQLSASDVSRLEAAARLVASFLRDESAPVKARAAISARVLRTALLPIASDAVASAVCFFGDLENGDFADNSTSALMSFVNDDLLIYLLETFQRQESVQVACLAVLTKMAKNLFPVSLLAAGPLVCAALQAFPKSYEVCETGCTCLAKLLLANAHTTGAWEGKLGTSQVFQTDAGEVFLMRGALRQSLSRAGATQSLLANLKRKSPLHIVEASLQALSHLSVGSTACEEIMNAHGSKVIMRRMRQHRQVEAVQLFGSVLLQHLCRADKFAKVAIVQSGGFKHVARILHYFKRSSLTVDAKALGLLQQLSKQVPEHQQAIVAFPRLIDRIAGLLRACVPLAAESNMDGVPNAASFVCLNGLMLFHALALAGHSSFLVESGVTHIAEQCNSTLMPAGIHNTAQQLSAALASPGEDDPFGSVFVQRNPSSSARRAASRPQKQMAQKISQAMQNPDLSSSSGESEDGVDSDDSNEGGFETQGGLSKSPFASWLSDSSAPLTRLGCRSLEPSMGVAKTGPMIGSAAAEVFKSVEDFVPPEEGQLPISRV